MKTTSPACSRSSLTINSVVVGGASERTLTVESDYGRVQLVLKDGDLHTLVVNNVSKGCSFEHLDDQALLAISIEITRHLSRKHLRLNRQLAAFD